MINLKTVLRIGVIICASLYLLVIVVIFTSTNHSRYVYITYPNSANNDELISNDYTIQNITAYKGNTVMAWEAYKRKFLEPSLTQKRKATIERAVNKSNSEAHSNILTGSNYSENAIYTATNESDILERFNQRQLHLTTVCGNQSGTDGSRSEESKEANYRHIVSDDVHKVLYCSIPKVGTTSWRSAITYLTREHSPYLRIRNAESPVEFHEDVVHRGGMYSSVLRPLSNYSVEERNRRLQSYTKFIFVRNPLQRVLSFYNSKFTEYNWYYSKMGQYIISKYRKNVTFPALLRGWPVNTDEYFMFLKDSGLYINDDHLKDFSSICLLSDISYDYIGKLETFEADAKFILSHVFNTTLRVPVSTSTRAPETVAALIARLKESISAELLQFTVEWFRRDFELFNYEIPNFFKK